MSFIEKRGDRYRTRFTDPTGQQHSRTFARKSDAQRFLRELDADMLRGTWVDPRAADTALADWTEEFVLLCRRLAQRTQETYRRDLTKYVLPRFGTYQLGHIPADEIENWLNDEIDLKKRKVRVTEQLVWLEDGSFVRREPKTAAGTRSITTSGFLSNHFGPARRAAGLTCRFHDLRHTSVALAIASGAHPKAIQARMGHSSINVTLDRYGHHFPELDVEIADSFGRQLVAAAERRS